MTLPYSELRNADDFKPDPIARLLADVAQQYGVERKPPTPLADSIMLKPPPAWSDEAPDIVEPSLDLMDFTPAGDIRAGIESAKAGSPLGVALAIASLATPGTLGAAGRGVVPYATKMQRASENGFLNYGQLKGALNDAGIHYTPEEAIKALEEQRVKAGLNPAGAAEYNAINKDLQHIRDTNNAWDIIFKGPQDLPEQTSFSHSMDYLAGIRDLPYKPDEHFVDMAHSTPAGGTFEAFEDSLRGKSTGAESAQRGWFASLHPVDTGFYATNTENPRQFLPDSEVFKTKIKLNKLKDQIALAQREPHDLLKNIKEEYNNDPHKFLETYGDVLPKGGLESMQKELETLKTKWGQDPVGAFNNLDDADKEALYFNIKGIGEDINNTEALNAALQRAVKNPKKLSQIAAFDAVHNFDSSAATHLEWSRPVREAWKHHELLSTEAAGLETKLDELLQSPEYATRPASLPLYARPGKMKVVDKRNTGYGDITKHIENAFKEGYDSIFFFDIDDPSRWGSHFFTKEGNRFRLPWANFDPARLNDPDLLAGMGGVGLAAALAGQERGE